MRDPAQIVEVHVSDRRALEPLGTKTKWWVRDYTHLFKVNYKARREDCSEVIVARLCNLLGLPHAEYQLGYMRIGDGEDIWDVKNGVLTTSFYQRPAERLVDGNQLLLSRDPAYPAENGYKVTEYTIEAVSRVVADLDKPPAVFCRDLPGKILTASDVFVGYLMLDVLVANQDRHHENWGAIRSGDKLMLTPTFDHGAALAPGETERSMLERLRTNDERRKIAVFAGRARSAFWGRAAGRQLSLFDAWREFSKFCPKASAVWQYQLREVPFESIVDVVTDLPEERFSDTAKEFCLELIRVNRQRLLADIPL